MASGRENETSTGTQVEEMTTYSHDTGGTVVATFYERGKSGYKDNVRRDDLERAVRMIESGQATRLVVWKIDRLMRNVRRFQDVMNRVERAGGQVVSKSESWMDTTTPIGYSIVGLVAAVAEQESRDRSVRITPWHGVRKREGMTPGGPRPYGYVRTPNKLTIDKDEAKVIRECAQRIIKGDTLRSIAMDLNARGVATGTEGSGQWTHTRVKRVVVNPTTAAKRTMRDGTFNDATTWKPILDNDTWTACRSILLDPQRCITKNNGFVHFLSGVLRCGKDSCGGVMRYRSHQKGGSIYMCATCSLSIKATDAESFVSGYMLDRIDHKAWVAMSARGKMTDTNAMDRMRKASDYERAQWLAGNRTDEEYEDALRDIKDNMTRLQTAPMLELPHVDSLHESWATMDASDKRMVVTAVFDSITVAPWARGLTGTERIDATMNANI
jgi:DNA invertase Pin-like site-specific DNA recombinase